MEINKKAANWKARLDALEFGTELVLPYPEEVEVVKKPSAPKIKAEIRKDKPQKQKEPRAPIVRKEMDITAALNELEHYIKETSVLRPDRNKPPDVLSMSKRASGDIVSKSIRVIKNIKRPMVFVPQVSDREWIRFNLIETLYYLQHDIVVSEFKYAGCIADIFSVVNGRGVEFEIKMSKADLLNDFQKRMSVGGRTPLKHDILASGKSMVSRFFFVVPQGLLLDVECPEYAGLITFDITMTNGWLFRIIKTAPLLHKNFISGSTWATIAKRLALKCRTMSMKYSKDDFVAVRRLGLWQPRP